MMDNQIFRHGFRGCIVSFAIMGATLLAMAISINYHYPEYASCGGLLGAGFPALFVCDDWGGSSPTTSWGKVTLTDILDGGIRPKGFLIDFLFYALLILAAVFVVSRIFQTPLNRNEIWWVAFISFGFIVGFLCSFLMFVSSDLYLGEYYYSTTQTSTSPSPTAVETLPAMITPISTPGP
jgi:hypothetical protein